MTEPFRPLEGITVVEMSHMIMGPSCGMFLGFLGATVIKVEPPDGDKTRHLTGMGRGFFPTFNRGKQSITLDLKAEEGRKALSRLLETADVFVENFRDSSLAKMGFAPEDLQQRYPRLIVTSCKGFLHGPYRNRTALDEVVQMMTGMAHMTGPSGRPLRIGSSANDIMGGLFGALSVLGALLERKESGKGRAIRVGLFENCLLLVAQHMVQYDIEGTEAPPMPERNFSWPVYDIFETADGRRIFVSSVTDSQWDTLCGLLGLQSLIDDPGLQNKMDQINARSRTIPIFAEAIRDWRYDDLAKKLEETGLAYAPVSRPIEMYDDPHVNRPGGLLESRMPEGGSFRAPGLPLDIDGAPLPVSNMDLAAVGEDTEAVLSGLGMSPAEIEAARGKSMEKAS
ncbi:CaiB/BaiF CoA transferase family protein [Hwanghaeella sp.]|uniref:CaiB/BaiF CoA transferase family protein n=1 Tax=Hwanghaeella sp. TaxID=2605943 RepID=UPI003CCBEE17